MNMNISDSNTTLHKKYFNREINIVAMHPAGLNDAEVIAFKKIIQAISERKLNPGIRLIEEELASIFNISRERIRRVLLVLAQYGIIKLEKNRGAFISVFSAIEKNNAFKMRGILEKSVVRDLCLMEVGKREAVFSSLIEHIDMEKEAINFQDRTLQITLSRNFHLHLAGYIENDLLTESLHGLLLKTSLSLSAHATEHDLACSMCEHESLIHAIKIGDTARAEAIMDAHLNHISDDISESLNDNSALHIALR